MALTCHGMACLTLLFYQAVDQLSGRLCSSALCITITLISSRRSAAALPVLDVSARLMPPPGVRRDARPTLWTLWPSSLGLSLVGP